MVKKIDVNNENYVIYKLGKWQNVYKINQVGFSSEIPVTEVTRNHVISSIDKIREVTFDLDDEKVNGCIAIGYSINPEIQKMDPQDIIELEEKEYNMIIDELNKLELLNKGSIPLDTEDYLIFKLEVHHHNIVSIPVNDFTKKYHEAEIKKLKEI